MTNHFTSKGRANHSKSHPRRAIRSRLGLAVVIACAALLAQPSFGQQAGNADSAKAPATRKKPAGRLPAHFAAVVSQKQRESIYKIQADFESQLEKLQSQMDALLAERDQTVDNVLTAEQLADVNKKRDEAKKKRAARNQSKLNAKTAADG